MKQRSPVSNETSLEPRELLRQVAIYRFDVTCRCGSMLKGIDVEKDTGFENYDCGARAIGWSGSGGPALT